MFCLFPFLSPSGSGGGYSVLSECKPAAKCPPPTTRATAATPPPAAGGRRSTTMSTGMANRITKKTLILKTFFSRSYSSGGVGGGDGGGDFNLERQVQHMLPSSNGGSVHYPLGRPSPAPSSSSASGLQSANMVSSVQKHTSYSYKMDGSGQVGRMKYIFVSAFAAATTHFSLH